jgi:hypothetical protein
VKVHYLAMFLTRGSRRSRRAGLTCNSARRSFTLTYSTIDRGRHKLRKSPGRATQNQRQTKPQGVPESEFQGAGGWLTNRVPQQTAVIAIMASTRNRAHELSLSNFRCMGSVLS